jgi:acetyl esterase/lipase
MATNTFEFSTEDVNYLTHGDLQLKLRLYKPRGAGPFPAVVDLHGGAWGKGSLEECRGRDEVLAKAGILAVALDFRDGKHGYPSALVDINYAIRWVKAHAGELRTRPDLIGISGQSSGGHLAMLAAMRPKDPRYAAVALPAGSPAADATVRCVAMSWPVINPLSRWRNAQRGKAAGQAWVGDILERQGSFWKNEDNQAEGNPMLMLERGEKVPMPPALWVQGRPDQVHDYRDPESPVPMNEPERFAANYRKAGGAIELLYIEQDKRQSVASWEPVAAFLLKHLPVEQRAAAMAK